MATVIEFSTDAYETIISHAREGTPHEVCGVLGGQRVEPSGGEAEDDAGSTEPEPADQVRSVHRAANVARSPQRTYLIDPEEQLAIMDDIEESGEEVLGFYHSHPTGPARPSEVDERRATWAGYSYAICLPSVPFVGSWHWNGETFSPEVLSLR
jgi:proteasome lid subunit RPN8/RPN11